MKRTGVYILLCSKGRYYTGSTDDIERRLVQHNKGSVKSTRNIRPVILKAFIEINDLKEARRMERQIKRQKSRAVLEQLIAEYPVG